MNQIGPSGFFVLRSPLLPLDNLFEWGDGLESAQVSADPVKLNQALAADRERLRTRLSTILSTDEVRDAIFIASSDLHESVDVWFSDPDSERGRRVERALVRYFLRMVGRSTPFGLFAGVSVGVIGECTELILEPRKNYRRHTRLDMDYISALIEAITKEPELRHAFVYRPNSSLYRFAGELRYVEGETKDKIRSYRLVELEEDDYLLATLERAEEGASLQSLTNALIDEEISQEEAEDYIRELIDSQILVPNVELPITGPEPIHPLVQQLSEKEETRQISSALQQTQNELTEIDRDGIGVSTARYRSVARILESLPAKVELGKIFQVDMVKPAKSLVLGKLVVDEMIRGIEILCRIGPENELDSLKRFREAFVARYETREVPLLEALDEESGIGFTQSLDASPLLHTLPFPESPAEELAGWNSRDQFLLRKLGQVLADGKNVVEFNPDDLDQLSSKNPAPLPDAFALTSTIIASSAEAVNRGDFQIVLDSIVGPSGARLLGRFCHADETLRKFVEQHLRQEEASYPEAIFAEIVHLSEGRLGNILSRPKLRDWEIPYLGASSVPVDHQIPASDLQVSVKGNRIVLRSKDLDREVIVRMTNAHNFSLSKLGFYRFLCVLQNQGVAPFLRWSWGVLRHAPFTPRVTAGRLILAPARWVLCKEDLKAFAKLQPSALFLEIQNWRNKLRMPRVIALQEADNLLPVDLENILSLETFIHLIKDREVTTLVEIFQNPDSLCVQGQEGRFAHEIVIPFITMDRVTQRGQKFAAAIETPIQRTFPPGSEWLYLKLYSGTATADYLLQDVLAPAIQNLMDSRDVNRWFFIRYADPDSHLRLRFYGDPERLQRNVLPHLQDLVNPLLHDGKIHRIQLDTYEREVERYGGPKGIQLAEHLFQIDSEAVLQILNSIDSGNKGLDQRWRIALCGLDLLLSDFGLDLECKLIVMKKALDEFRKEFQIDAVLKKFLGEKLRKERSNLLQLISADRNEQEPYSCVFEILRQRSDRLAPIVAELRNLINTGQIIVPLDELIPSYIHMFVNRLLRSGQRKQELILYDFLSRIYESQLAQSRIMAE